ncbi:MAG TPA: DUF47 family protein [Acidimicrobiales bacterium]|nr:DUF47 family protein [Acidimicrobiales bacterium]
MKRWFLPESPDLLGLLSEQGRITIEGLDALSDWAHGDRPQEAVVRTCEHRADAARRKVLLAVKRSFVTPVAPEDIFELSERLDRILNAAKNLVREADLLAMDPDPPMAEMVDLVVLGTRELVGAFPDLSADPGRATDAADTATRRVRRIEHVYRRAMSALLEEGGIREVGGKRELYRRCSRMGDAVEHVANRIWYAVVKGD